MKDDLRLTRDDEQFLEKAYLLKPEGNCNISSLGVFDDDIDAHDAFDFAGLRRLTRLGYIVGVEDSTWTIGKRQVDVTVFRLTPLGLSQAEQLLSGRRRYSLMERLEAVTRSDWIALVALLVAVIALFQAAD